RRTRLSTTQKFEFQLSLTSSLSDVDEANGAIVRTLLRQGPVEAGACACMAGHAVALDVRLEPQHVLIAIRPDFSNAKEVAALLALLPDALPRARPEMRQSGLDGERQRLSVHPCEHENVTGIGIGDDRRDQSVRPELRLENVAALDFLCRAAGGEEGRWRSHSKPPRRSS